MSEVADRELADLARRAATAALAGAASGGPGAAAEMLTEAGGGIAAQALAREAGELGPAATGPAEHAAATLFGQGLGEQDLAPSSDAQPTAEADGGPGPAEARSEPGESGPAEPGLRSLEAATGLPDVGPLRSSRRSHETVDSSGSDRSDRSDRSDDTDDSDTQDSGETDDSDDTDAEDINDTDGADEADDSDTDRADEADDSDTDAADADEPGRLVPDEGESRAAFPDWLRQLLEACGRLIVDNIPPPGTTMAFNDVRLASTHILESYVPNTEIVQRGSGQLAELGFDTAKTYIDSLHRTYDIGERIADTLANRAAGIAGDSLAGRHILELPPQTAPIPAEILHYAASYEVIMRDTNGKVYP